MKRSDDGSKREDRIKRLTSGPVYPLLVRMAIPSMIGMMVSTVYSMTDTYFIGKLNNVDLTASVGIVFSFVSVIQAVGFWFGYGSGNHISRSLGKNDTKAAGEMAATGVLAAVITGIVIMAVGLLCLDRLAVILGAGTGELKAATIRYLRITILTVPFMLVSNVLYNQLRLAGSGSDSMKGLLVGMVLNMVLDPFFILVMGMDVEGAAAASMIGQISGCLVLLWNTERNGNVRIRLGSASLNAGNIKEILAGGAPNFCRQGISSISSVMLNNVAGTFGNYAIASLTIALRISYIAYALVIGFGQGFQPICAINYGAGKYDRIKTAFKYALITVSVFLVISVAFLFFGAKHLVAGFSKDADVASLAVRMIHAQCMIMPFMGYYILCGMFLQNIGRFGKATIVTISENGTFLIPAMLIMPGLMGIDGLVYCRPAASLFALVLSLIIGTGAWNKYLDKDQYRSGGTNVKVYNQV
ncbi:MAG: MATE family efflux transporter [Lachnospiraceae bacterium]|nr:MATE family efflux transporter [Lachnospiraceae bacterium]